MDPILSSVQEYIKSGEYFADAKKWYNFKYVTPLSQRSLLFLTCTVFLILLITICVSINALLPIKQKVSYAVQSKTEKHATITDTNKATQHDPYTSLVNIMIKNYLTKRETYNYNTIKEQFTFIQNTSTRIVYMQFVNFMNIDNPLSPVMRYQKLFRRSVVISSITNINDNEVTVIFESLAKNTAGEILENMVWEATIGFIMDSINSDLAPGSPYNFTVTSYKLKLLKDKNKK